MDAFQVLAYVHASAPLLGLSLDDAQARRVAQHLERTTALAALLEAVELAPEDELAEIYSLLRPQSPPTGAL